ncbi:ABC transporter substrate-binding protein, partial [Streptomyces albidoflavus]
MSPTSPPPAPTPATEAPGARRRPRFFRAPLRAGALGLALALGLTACGTATEDKAGDKPKTRVFKADNGEIEIPADPMRV